MTKKPPPGRVQLYNPLGGLIPMGPKGTGLPEDRVLDRNAGCFNCSHFDTGAVYHSKVGASYTRDVAAYQAGGMSRQGAEKTAEATRRTLRAGRGHIGVCLKGQTEGDFVAAQHLCEKWDARLGASLARSAGEPLSPLIQEAYDRLGEAVPSVGVVSSPADVSRGTPAESTAPPQGENGGNGTGSGAGGAA